MVSKLIYIYIPGKQLDLQTEALILGLKQTELHNQVQSSPALVGLPKATERERKPLKKNLDVLMQEQDTRQPDTDTTLDLTYKQTDSRMPSAELPFTVGLFQSLPADSPVLRSIITRPAEAARDEDPMRSFQAELSGLLYILPHTPSSTTRPLISQTHPQFICGIPSLPTKVLNMQ